MPFQPCQLLKHPLWNPFFVFHSFPAGTSKIPNGSSIYTEVSPSSYWKPCAPRFHLLLFFLKGLQQKSSSISQAISPVIFWRLHLKEFESTAFKESPAVLKQFRNDEQMIPPESTFSIWCTQEPKCLPSSLSVFLPSFRGPCSTECLHNCFSCLLFFRALRKVKHCLRPILPKIQEFFHSISNLSWQWKQLHQNLWFSRCLCYWRWCWMA